MNRYLGMLMAGGFVSLLGSAADATVLQKKSLDDLFVDSELVFAGTLAATTSDVDAGGMPWTLYTFTDLDIIAGTFAGQELSLRCPGGVLDGLVTKVQGTPDFEVGETSLVFFDEDDWCQTAGWFQGEYKIVDDPQGSGEPIVVNGRGQGIVGLSEDGFIFGERVWAPAQRAQGVRSAPAADPSNAAVGAATPWDVVRGELEAFWAYTPAAARRAKRAAKSQTQIAGQALPVQGARNLQAPPPRGQGRTTPEGEQ